MGQNRATTHDADDHVGDQHRRAEREDGRPDAAAFPAVTEERHLRLMPEAFADGPEPRADEENRQRNHETGRRRHQAIDADALTIRLTGNQLHVNTNEATTLVLRDLAGRVLQRQELASGSHTLDIRSSGMVVLELRGPTLHETRLLRPMR